MAEEKLVDHGVLEALGTSLGNDKSFMGELIGLFMSDSTKALGKMREALTRGDAAEVRLAAHSLKTSSNTVGALHLGSLFQGLEKIAAGGSLEGAPVIAASIEEEFPLVKTQLEEWRRVNC